MKEFRAYKSQLTPQGSEKRKRQALQPTHTKFERKFVYRTWKWKDIVHWKDKSLEGTSCWR